MPEPAQFTSAWYTGPFNVHPGAVFPDELVRWECPRHGLGEFVTRNGCALCLDTKNLEPSRVVFARALDEERRNG